MRFIPRDALDNPGGFGVLPGVIPPAEGLATTDLKYQGAILQHFFARRVQLELVAARTNPSKFLKPFAGDPNLKAQRVRRIFNGATSATIEDFAFWGAQFPVVWPELAQVKPKIAEFEARQSAQGQNPPQPRR